MDIEAVREDIGTAEQSGQVSERLGMFLETGIRMPEADGFVDVQEEFMNSVHIVKSDREFPKEKFILDCISKRESEETVAKDSSRESNVPGQVPMSLRSDSTHSRHKKTWNCSQCGYTGNSSLICRACGYSRLDSGIKTGKRTCSECKTRNPRKKRCCGEWKRRSSVK